MAAGAAPPVRGAPSAFSWQQHPKKQAPRVKVEAGYSLSKNTAASNAISAAFGDMGFEEARRILLLGLEGSTLETRPHRLLSDDQDGTPEAKAEAVIGRMFLDDGARRRHHGDLWSLMGGANGASINKTHGVQRSYGSLKLRVHRASVTLRFNVYTLSKSGGPRVEGCPKLWHIPRRQPDLYIEKIKQEITLPPVDPVALAGMDPTAAMVLDLIEGLGAPSRHDRPLTGDRNGSVVADRDSAAIAHEMGQMKEQLSQLAQAATQAQAASRAMEAKLDRALATIDKLAGEARTK